MQTLVRGQRAALSSLGVADAVTVGVGAGGRGTVFALGVDESGRHVEGWLLRDGISSPCGSAAARSADAGDDCAIHLRLDGVPEHVARVAVCLDLGAAGSMADVGSGHLRVIGTQGEVARYVLTSADFPSERAIIAAEVYRKGGVWRVAAVGQGYADGLPALLDGFGAAHLAWQSPRASAPANPPQTASATAAPTAPPAAPATPEPAATPAPSTPPAGWHPDPWTPGALRYWDGATWTGHVSGPDGDPDPAPATADAPAAADPPASPRGIADADRQPMVIGLRSMSGGAFAITEIPGFRFLTGQPPRAGIEISSEPPLFRVVGGVRILTGKGFDGIGEVAATTTRLFIVGSQGKADGRFLDDAKTGEIMLVAADLASVTMIGVREQKKVLGGKVARAAALGIDSGDGIAIVEIEPMGEVLQTLIANLRDPMPTFQRLAELVAARRGQALPAWQRDPGGGPVIEFPATA